MSDYNYDLLVLGGGPAGSAAAKFAAREHRRVALVEADLLGGTCLNYGCDPTKALLHAADLLHNARHAREFGVNIEQVAPDWPAAVARVKKLINRFRGGTHEEAIARQQRRGIDIYIGHASFKSPREVEVDGKILTSERIVIATGAKTALPPIEGLNSAGFITNVQAVTCDPFPKTMVVVGAGPIGLEFAQIYSRFGAKVTVLEALPRILPMEDRKLAKCLHKLLQNEGIAIETSVNVDLVEKDKNHKLVTWSRAGNSTTLGVEALLIATGRRANTEGLNLQAAGVKTSDRGIAVDDTLQTSAPGIWAAGDVTGIFPFTHVAAPQGTLAAENAFSNKPDPCNYNAVPWAIFTSPTLARVGQTQEELERDQVEFRVMEMPLEKIPRAIITGNTEGLLRILAKPDGSILGAHALGDRADDWLGPVVLAMRAGLPVQQLAKTIFTYPSFVQAVGFAAARFNKT